MRIETCYEVLNFDSLLKSSASSEKLSRYTTLCAQTLAAPSTRSFNAQDYLDYSEEVLSLTSTSLSLCRSIARTIECLTLPFSRKAEKAIALSKLTALPAIPLSIRDTVTSLNNFFLLCKNKDNKLNVIDESLGFVQNVSGLAEGFSVIFRVILVFKKVNHLEKIANNIDNVTTILGLISIVVDIKNLFNVIQAYHVVNYAEHTAYTAAFKKRFVYEGISISLSLLSNGVYYVAEVVFKYNQYQHVGWMLYAASSGLILISKGVSWNADRTVEREMKNLPLYGGGRN